MIPVLLSALFPESGPAELANLAGELGFAGLELAVHGSTQPEAERTIAQIAAAGLPVRVLSLDTAEPRGVREWAAAAAGWGVTTLRLAPLTGEAVDDQVAELAQVAADGGSLLLLPHHPGSAVPDPSSLARLLEQSAAPGLAGVLAPDLVPRSRAGDHTAWLARLALPRLGAVAIGAYRWDSEIGSGNVRLWSPRAAHLPHGLTPWTEWLGRIAETGFDGLFCFGDATLSATLGERLRTARDDLRVVRRLWRPAS